MANTHRAASDVPQYPPMSAVEIVWRWIIDANDGIGGDVDDLIDALNRAGLACPEGLEDNA